MQYVNEKWLRLFNYYYLAVVSILGIMYAYFAIDQRTLLVPNKNIYGISIATGIFAISGVLYNLLFLKLIRRVNIWLAYLISFSLFALACNAAVESSLAYKTSLIFLLQNILVAYAATTFGPAIALMVLGIVGVVFAMTVSGTTDPTILGVSGDGLSMIVRVTGVVALLLWLKDKYLTLSPIRSDNYIEHFLVKNQAVKLLTDSIGDGVIIIDKNANIKSVNPGILKLLSQAEKDIIDLDHKSVLKFQSLDHKSMNSDDNPITKALATQKSLSRELILIVQNDQELYIDITVSPIINQQTLEQYGAIITLRDVSKKKEEETARSEFISTASHEMRTPVAAIEGYLGLALSDKVSTIDQRARSYLQKAHTSTEHLGRLLEDLLLSAKAEDGRLISHPQAVEMSQFIEQLVDTLRFTTDKKGLEVDFTIGANAIDKTDTMNGKVIKPLYYAYIDPDRMREVMTNLFENAVKYTEAGKVTVGLTGNNDVVQIFVKDTGAGIPAADVGHLFQKFYRVDNSATRTIGGTGLGLFICRKIVELYKGRIWVESEFGKGSTFFINLPRLENQRANHLISMSSNAPNTQKATIPK